MPKTLHVLQSNANNREDQAPPREAPLLYKANNVPSHKKPKPSSCSGPLPGLVHQELFPSAGEVLHVAASLAVDAVPRRLAHGEEVWPQAADGVLGDVRQGLAGGRSEHVAAHCFVDARHVLGPRRLVLDARHVNRKALAADDLGRRRNNV